VKRLLCAAAIAAAATAVPAHAASEAPVHVKVYNDGTTVGVGATHGSGTNEQPVGGAFVNTSTGRACVGLSYQIPFCTDDLR
jgi:opacity protein-like surface antigen